jgi:centrosomal protein CEP41
MSGVSAVTYATEALGITDQTSFLLLDLREPEEYDMWRIKESINYPAANIARDKVIPELFRFKNKANKLIIVYMNDERKGCAAANLLTEKGYENVFLLSGGIDQFNEEFNFLVEGRDVPKPRSLT